MVLFLLINELLTNSKCISHVLQCETAVWLQQLGVSVYSHLPDIVSTVWIEQAILFEKIFYVCCGERKYIIIIIDHYLYITGFACSMQAIVTPAKYYLADHNLGEIKHQAIFAGGLNHQSYYK